MVRGEPAAAEPPGERRRMRDGPAASKVGVGGQPGRSWAGSWQRQLVGAMSGRQWLSHFNVRFRQLQLSWLKGSQPKTGASQPTPRGIKPSGRSRDMGGGEMTWMKSSAGLRHRCQSSSTL